MANKEYICVYQDCPLCGDKGRKLKKLILDNQLNVRKVSFASEEGKEHCYQAVFLQGIKTMPFFFDGTHYAATLEELIKPKEEPKLAPVEKKKTTRKRTTKKKEVKHESI